MTLLREDNGEYIGEVPACPKPRRNYPLVLGVQIVKEAGRWHVVRQEPRWSPTGMFAGRMGCILGSYASEQEAEREARC